MGFDVFDKLGEARASGGGAYFKPGNYVIKVLGVKLVDTFAGHQSFVVEGEVLESANSELQPGYLGAQVVAIKNAILQTAMGNIKNFCAAALGIENADSYVPDGQVSPTQYWKQAATYFCADEQPLRGKVLKLFCVEVPTREKHPDGSPKMFTKHIWSPAEEYEDEDVGAE